MNWSTRGTAKMTPILVWQTHFESYLLFVWMTRLKMGAATRAILKLQSRIKWPATSNIA